MINKLLNMLGLARRAGRLSLGNDMVLEALQKNKSQLIVFACDISERTKKNIENEAGDIQIITLPVDMTELGCSIGKRCAVVSVNDKGFADKINEYAKEINNIEVGGTLNGNKKGHEA